MLVDKVVVDSTKKAAASEASDARGGSETANLAVVGCGYWGKNLVRNFAQLGVLRFNLRSTYSKSPRVLHPEPRQSFRYTCMVIPRT